MKKGWLLLLFIPLLINCAHLSDIKTLDLKAFKISVPKNWKYIKQQGEDSFIGEFEIAPKSRLSFDYSGMGYANHLIKTEQEFLTEERWSNNECYFCKTGVSYVPKWDLKRAKAEEVEKKKLTDANLVKVAAYPEYKKNIHLPTSAQKIKYPKADYVADLTYKDSTIFIPIELPLELKIHNIKIDSNERYVYKTIWPKTPGKGMTGIYIHSRKSHFNFQLNGKNLSVDDQEKALTAFKTIAINEK